MCLELKMLNKMNTVSALWAIMASLVWHKTLPKISNSKQLHRLPRRKASFCCSKQVQNFLFLKACLNLDFWDLIFFQWRGGSHWWDKFSGQFHLGEKLFLRVLSNFDRMRDTGIVTAQWRFVCRREVSSLNFGGVCWDWPRADVEFSWQQFSVS